MARTIHLQAALPKGCTVQVVQEEDDECCYLALKVLLPEGPGLARTLPPPSDRLVKESA